MWYKVYDGPRDRGTHWGASVVEIKSWLKKQRIPFTHVVRNS